ncbi:MAG: TonB-dependent receptor, partial [Steroidobacteraceae bacterium]
TINHDFGFAQLVSLTSRRIAKGLNRFDSDNTPLTIVHFNTPQDVKTWTQELQLLAPTDSTVDWTLGAFYFDNKAAYDPARLIGAPFGGELDIFGKQHTKSASLYGQATMKVLESTAVTVGLRYTDEKQDLTQAVGPPGGMAPIPGDSNKFNKLTWRLAVNQSFTDHVRGYVSYNRGIKSGGFDLLGPGAPPYKPEILDAYEIGMKSELLDQRIRLNLAAYYYDYQDIQVSSNPQGTIVTNNAASAEVKGLEAELEFAVTSQLRIYAGANLMEGEYGDYPNPTIFPPSPFDPPVTLANADGQDMVRSPKFTGNVSINYSLPSAVGTFDLATSAFHSSKFYWDVDNRLDSPAYTIYGASVTWHSIDDKLDVKLWGDNLTDKAYLITGVPNGNGDSLQFAAPRTYGVTLGVHF